MIYALCYLREQPDDEETARRVVGEVNALMPLIR